MSTLTQLIRNSRSFRIVRSKRRALAGCPQKKATCLKVFVMTPRKPNSALRKVTWADFSNHAKAHAYIPGISHNLTRHSRVWVRGGRVKDLPGMKYHLIRGKGDLRPLANRTTCRSKYGVKKTPGAALPKRYKRQRYW